MKNKQVLIFGEVLFDCFPDGNVVLGGAPFNVAWHLQAFGISPLFISRIGNDSYGEMIREAMIDWGMSISGLQIDSIHPTGMVTVQFNNNEPHYEIVENSAYDFIEYSSLPELKEDSILYHGSLALRNNQSATTFEKIKTSIAPFIFMDINLRKPWWNLEKINLCLKEISWLKLNEEELSLIVPNQPNVQSRIDYLFSSFPLKLITLTQGAAGATSFHKDGTTHQIAPSQVTKIKDTVGAGDSFSSILLLGTVKGWELPTTLTRAQEFASAVVGIQGATTKDQSFYDSFLTKWN